MSTVTKHGDLRVAPGVRDWIGAEKGLLIGETFVPARDGETFATVDPATGREITRVPEAKAEDVELAVRAARRAFKDFWARTSASERARLLNRLADLIDRHADELAQLESLDTGKPVTRARTEDVPLTADGFRYSAASARLIEGSTIPVGVPDAFVYTRREPVGVVGAIVAWNFPLVFYSWKLGPALAAGCTVVLKPAEQTPLTALRLGELVLEAGFPPGALNICPGQGETAGDALVRHPDVNTIVFTGSGAVGREVARNAADTHKRVFLELGGKSPNIVFADADLESAATTAAAAIFWNSGQVCCAGSRLMVERSAYDQVIETVVREARAHRLGPGLDPETTLGPLVSADQLARVRGYIDSGLRDGVGIVTGGQRPASEGGYFVEPTVLTDVPDHLTVCREEIFGPVLVAQPFDSLEEVAARANRTEYGLAASVWTGDLRRGHKMAALLQAGTVWLNTYHLYDAAVPFGGFRASGYGRDQGRESIEKYLQTKAVWTSLA
jgi:acyl-CoA reductase-like NAD-dependent aldehyde dehydrogenase